MEVFQGNYKIYHSVMCLSGLWPYDNSILTRIHRIAFTLFLLGCMVTQVMTIKNIKMSLNETIGMISFGAQLLLYFIRYFTTILTFPTTKYVLDNMQNDFIMLKDPIEAEMLLKDSILAKRILLVYIGLTCTGSLCVMGTLGISTFLQSDIQIRFLYLLGFFYDEKNLRTNLTCWHIIISTMHGLLTMICSEGTVTVLGTHLSGLLEVSSYRMRNAIDKVATSRMLRRIDIQPAVDLHRRAIQYSKKYADDMMIPSMIMMIVVVSSFGVNIYRLYISITEVKEIDAVILALQFVVAYMAFIIGNNYSGQIVVDNSIKMFEEIYNSLWYRIPIKMQKTVLFAFMNAQSLVAFNLAGLFILCLEGLAMMISSSFSYFTLLCSVQ
ncbi:uncharacterized protein LOC143355395 isoform X1 [Halictus rubicundus]|uniref:uncharacterized protein LOC143355395 isoform X1 n=2 Tax=Halictus rubicundus TaxID=77578 RepID=UPI00403732F2